MIWTQAEVKNGFHHRKLSWTGKTTDQKIRIYAHLQFKVYDCMLRLVTINNMYIAWEYFQA